MASLDDRPEIAFLKSALVSVDVSDIVDDVTAAIRPVPEVPEAPTMVTMSQGLTSTRSWSNVVATSCASTTLSTAQ
jgi:hypothetical protein